MELYNYGHSFESKLERWNGGRNWKGGVGEGIGSIISSNEYFGAQFLMHAGSSTFIDATGTGKFF